MPNHYVDSDGHVMEKVDEIAERIGKVNAIEGEINPRRMVPSLDRFHTPRLQRRTPGTFDPSIGPERWMEFLDKTGLEYSVLYPTEGLAYGQISLVQWAVAYARGYNDWLFEKYLQFSPKFKGVALIPMQDVPSAVAELRRAVKELGMVGAMLASGSREARLRAGCARRLLWRSGIQLLRGFPRHARPRNAVSIGDRRDRHDR
jgi:predicted TIM-barrel fold metal-dependent hydrolase